MKINILQNYGILLVESLHTCYTQKVSASNSISLTIHSPSANETQKITVQHGTLLRTALIQSGLSPYLGKHQIFNCRGMGICGTCKVRVKENGEWWEKRSCQIQCFNTLEIQLK
ncbi:hypothetical protein EBR78_02845 [bacterium]|nr:hypothetical protein [bacterium]